MSQYEVDFVIPRVGVDLPVGIDPFLLYKSRDPAFRSLHSTLIGAFNVGVEAVARGDLPRARHLFDYPEVAAIGMGYTRGSKKGSGVGTQLTGLILQTLASSPSLLERGVRHVEEMQLVSAGIGPDRVSDISANVLKQFLIEYTQRQCELWGIPVVAGVPVSHVYDAASMEWEDGYFDLPVSPIDGSPILLVPRRFVRALPWINYDDFLRTEFRAYLQAKRQGLGRTPTPDSGATQANSKPEVVAIAQKDIALIDRYVASRERAASEARPAMNYLDGDMCRESEELKRRLVATPTGRESASVYQMLVLEILNFLFNPELIDGTPEVRTYEGTERRDIIFTNDSDETFWDYVRGEHSSLLLMFETKNMASLDGDAFNQTATYLGDRLGTLGFIVTRQPISEAMQKKAFSIWNDSGIKRKVILVLTDNDLNALLDAQCRGQSPTQWMQRHYRSFRTAVQ